MKNIFITLLVAGSSLAPMAAFAADCTIVACGNGPIVSYSDTWGANAVPVSAGTIVTDFHGKQDTCYAWMGIMGCIDIGHTAFYEARVI